MKRMVVYAVLMLLLVFGLHVGSAAETATSTNPPTLSSADSLSDVPSLVSGGSLFDTPSEFAEDVHPSTLTYRSYFRTRTARQGNLIFSVEEGVYQQDQATDLLARVLEDMRVISAAIPVIDKPYTIYVVKATLNGGVQQVGDAVYCTAKDINNGYYRSALIASVSGISAYWKTVGLSGVLFEQSIDDMMLHAYYEQVDNLDILSLFTVYFHSEFASDEEMLIVRETALSLADHIIRQYGMNTFLSEDRPEDRQEWLHFLGVNRDYSDAYAETLADYQYLFWQYGYPLVVKTDKGDMIYMHHREGDLDSAAQVRAFLYEANVGMKAILHGIAIEAPEYIQSVLDNYRDPITVYYGPSFTDYTLPYTRKIELRSSHNYFHEMVHILIRQPSGNASYDQENWKYEAISEYLSYTFFQAPRLKKDCYEAVLNSLHKYGDSTISKVSPEGFEIRVALKYQQRHGALSENWTDFDVRSYCELWGWEQTLDRLANPDIELEWAMPIGGITHWRGKKTGGNELTYFQSYCFADYLAETQGLPVFLKYCIEDTSFEEAFGLTYEDAKEAWMKHDGII